MENLTAESIFQELRKTVVGQDEFLKVLSNAAFLHHLRYNYAINTGETIDKPKQNILCLGHSGTGKTLAVQTIGKILHLPVIIQDSSQLTGSGWRGESCSSIIAKAVNMAEKITDAAFSIVILDEFDKSCRSARQKNVRESGFSPLDNLLSFIAGSVVVHSENNRTISLDTSHMLVICLGAFENLDNIIRNRISSGKRIGFSSEYKEEQPDEDLIKLLKDEDLLEFGIPNEILGRISQITKTNTLTSDDYRKILTESKVSPIHQFDNLLYSSYGVHVLITDDAVECISQEAAQSTTGARMLSRIVTEALQPAIYDIGNDHNITEIILDAGVNGLFTGYVSGERPDIQEQEKIDFSICPDVDYLVLSEIPFFCIKGRTEIWQYATEIKNMASIGVLPLEHILAATNILAAGICLQLYYGREEKNLSMLQLYGVLDAILQKRTAEAHPLFNMFLDFMEKAKTYTNELTHPVQTAKQILIDYANAYKKEREQAEQ